MANLLPAVTTLFLLLLTLATGDTDSDLVLDAYGKPLEVGSPYSIERIKNVWISGRIGRSGRGGPLSCPLYVIQYRDKLHRGDPLKFVPVNETQKEIHLSSDVKIDSGFSAYCRDDGLWKLSYDASNSRVVVIASGIFNQSRASFKIEKSTPHALNSFYKITTSAIQPALEQKGLYYLTVFRDSLSGMDMVGLTDDPHQAANFLFYKLKKDVVASI